jgi:phage shock protein C
MQYKNEQKLVFESQWEFSRKSGICIYYSGIYIPSPMRKNHENKWFGGVLSGIGDSLGISPTLLRIIFIVLFFGIGGISLGISSGAMVVIYFICWIIMD